MAEIIWSSETCHSINSETMQEYLDEINMLDILKVEGSYAEGRNCKGVVFAIHAGGNGDGFNHKVTFEVIS